MTETRADYWVEQAEEHTRRQAAEERERLRLAYALMERVFDHVAMAPRTEAMGLLRQMHDTISTEFNWPPLGAQRGD